MLLPLGKDILAPFNPGLVLALLLQGRPGVLYLLMAIIWFIFTR